MFDARICKIAFTGRKSVKQMELYGIPSGISLKKSLVFSLCIKVILIFNILFYFLPYIAEDD